MHDALPIYTIIYRLLYWGGLCSALQLLGGAKAPPAPLFLHHCLGLSSILTYIIRHVHACWSLIAQIYSSMISMLLAITPHINWALTFIHFKMKMIVQGWGSTMTEHAQKFGRYSFFFIF